MPSRSRVLVRLRWSCARAVVLALVLLAIGVWPASAAADEQVVLLLLPVPPGRPMFDTLVHGILNELQSPGAPPFDVRVETLNDLLGDEAQQLRQERYLRARYQGRRLGAIVALLHPAYADVRTRLGVPESVPLVFLTYGTVLPPIPNSTRLIAAEPEVGTYLFMRELRPGAHRVALLAGGSRVDRRANRNTLEQLRQHLPPDRVLDLTGLPIDRLRARARALKADTWVLLGNVFADEDGRALTPAGLLAAVGPLQAPVIVPYDLGLGPQVLGGLVYEVTQVGQRVGAVVRRVAAGESADRLPPLPLPRRALLNVPELARFEIPEGRVPAGARLLYRPPSLWETYRRWIVLGSALMGVQTALIAGLLAERRRRRDSQRQLAERLRLQAVVSTVSTRLAHLSEDRVDGLVASSLALIGDAFGAEACAIWTWTGAEQPHLLGDWTTPGRATTGTTLVDAARVRTLRPRLEHGEDVLVTDPASAAVVDGLPLSVDGRVIGVLTLQRRHDTPWTRQQLVDLRTTGEIVATAVVRVRTTVSVREQLHTLGQVERVAGLGTLAASLAHELNQPLAAILSNAEVAQHLLADPSPPLDELRAIIADVIADDERAGAIIRNVRTMLRAHQASADCVDVGTVMRDVVRLAAHDVRLRGGLIEPRVAHGLPRVRIDATRLTQVLLNLLGNAVDASVAAGRPVRMTMHARPAGTGVLLEVLDDGPGIAAEVLPRLFTPFVTTKRDGLGIGLSISRTIVETAGGRISADNRPEGGAAFRVWLPHATPMPTSGDERHDTAHR